MTVLPGGSFSKKLEWLLLYTHYTHIHKKGELKEGVVRREQGVVRRERGVVRRERGEVRREKGGVERGYKTYRREILVKPALNVCHGLTG